MEIQALRLFLSEQEANQLLAGRLPPDTPVKQVRVRITPDGVRVSGEYPTMLANMPFDTHWRLAVVNGQIEVRLADLTAGGFPVPLRGLVLRALGDHIAAPGLRVTDEAILVDVQEVVRRQDPPVRLEFHLRSVTCVAGGVVVEAGWPGSPGASAPGGSVR
jgi:hypothetical protein